MDYSKKGINCTVANTMDRTVSRQLMTGIGQTVHCMLKNGAARIARVAGAVPRATAATAENAVDPRYVTPAEDTQEPK